MSFGSGISWLGTLHRQGFWSKINCSQMKLPNFGSPSSDSSSEIGRHFRNKSHSIFKLSQNAFYKKGAPKLIFFNEIFFRMIRMSLTEKIDFESQNFAIFDNFYSTDHKTLNTF